MCKNETCVSRFNLAIPNLVQNLCDSAGIIKPEPHLRLGEAGQTPTSEAILCSQPSKNYTGLWPFSFQLKICQSLWNKGNLGWWPTCKQGGGWLPVCCPTVHHGNLIRTQHLPFLSANHHERRNKILADSCEWFPVYCCVTKENIGPLSGLTIWSLDARGVKYK